MSSTSDSGTAIVATGLEGDSSCVGFLGLSETFCELKLNTLRSQNWLHMAAVRVSLHQPSPFKLYMSKFFVRV